MYDMSAVPSSAGQTADEKLHAALINSIRGIVWEADPVMFRFSFVSPRAVKILGYPARQWLDQPDFWRAHTHPDDVEWCAAFRRAATDKGEDHEFEYRMIAADGRTVWLHDIVTVVRSDDGGTRLRGIMFDSGEPGGAGKAIKRDERVDGEVGGSAGCPPDIDKRPQAGDVPRESRLRLDEIFAFLPDATFAIDMEGRVIAWNRVMEEMTGKPAAGMLGKGYHEYSTPFYENQRPLLADLVISGKEEIARMYDFVHKTGEKLVAGATSRTTSGQLHYYSCIAAPLFGSDGKMIGAIEQIRDITDLRLAEERLRESEERYRKLVELSPDAVYIHVDGILIFANAAGAALLGARRPEEIHGRRALDFVHPDYRDIVVQRLGRLMLNGEPNPLIEQIFVRLDGSNVPVDVASLAFNYQGREAVLVVAHDITERKKMQEELFKAQKLESLGVLAGGIAHDFNNLLTGILGNLSLARIRLDPSHKIAKHIDECEKAAMRASDLAQQLLTFARGGEPVKNLLDPAALIRETASFVLRGSNVRGDLRLADDLWCLEADSGQISQVLHNILINAVQAMPLGGEVAVRATNEKCGAADACQLPSGEYVRIVIEDHGGGIPRENLTRIFDPYFTTKPGGSGLGLASAYSIVRRHGGAVEVSSTVGRGTSFTINLPASPGKCPSGGTIGKQAELVGNGRVLVMDDEEVIRQIVTEILEFMGYDVETCSDGHQAVERFRSARERNLPFDAVILDLTVPGGMGGREAAERIRQCDPAAVLIVSSGYSSDPVVANYRRYGFSGAVPKPYTVDSLAAELETLLHGRAGRTGGTG